MNTILIPAREPDDWQHLLADPDKHWRVGYCARALANCWQSAGGIPPEVLRVLTDTPELAGVEALFCIPEHPVPLPGGSRPSQNDIWVLARTAAGPISIAVEGKVAESFGPTIAEWSTPGSRGKETRLSFLCSLLGLSLPPPENLRYQLLHRTASAIVEAERLSAEQAMMLVHSFSQEHARLEDYERFLDALGVTGSADQVASRRLDSGIRLHLAWVTGDVRWLSA